MGAESEHIASQHATLRWAAGLGVVTAEALASREGSTVASARARLQAAERRGQMRRSRPLTAQPSLYTVTRAGMQDCGLRGLDPPRVTPANAAHAVACAAVAARLELSYPSGRLIGEPELRREEREGGAPIASARLGRRPDGGPLMHRPDLVLFSDPRSGGAAPVAVEVELTVKAPRRLLGICRAWARCREVSGVLYIASPDAERALGRAVLAARADRQIVVMPLSLVLVGMSTERTAFGRTIPTDA
jgi:hypothetical protein